MASYQELLAQAAAHAAAASRTPQDVSDEAGCPVFLVSKVVNASGGRTGCFLYQGKLLTPEPRSRTPDCRSLGGGGGGSSSGGSSARDDGQANLSDYEGHDLTLYMSYEEASPKIKQRTACADAPAAPWRAILRDQQDDMLYCLRGLPSLVLFDEQLHLVTWGPNVAIAFATSDEAEAFVKGLCRVEVRPCCLGRSAQGALVAAHTARQSLGPQLAQQAAKAEGAAPSTCAAAACSYPPSPALCGDVGCCRAGIPPPPALAGGKRKAEAPLSLMTPMVKPRFCPIFTPTCSTDLMA